MKSRVTVGILAGCLALAAFVAASLALGVALALALAAAGGPADMMPSNPNGGESFGGGILADPDPDEPA